MAEASDSGKKTLTVYRVIVGMLALGFLGVCVLFTILLASTWREYRTFEEREAANQARLVEIRQEKAGREAYLRKLLDDSDFRERVIRERLGYSREDELLFRFDKN